MALETEALLLKLEGFEGPLDLLLELARTQKVDLAKISILHLVEQFLAVIEGARRVRLELAADWLVMAAWLTWLKSRLLVPQLGEPEDAETAAEILQARLMDLQAMRQAAAWMGQRPQLGWDVFERGIPEELTETGPLPAEAGDGRAALGLSGGAAPGGGQAAISPQADGLFFGAECVAARGQAARLVAGLGQPGAISARRAGGWRSAPCGHLLNTHRGAGNGQAWAARFTPGREIRADSDAADKRRATDLTADEFTPAMRLAEAAIFAATQPVTARVLTNLLPEDADVDSVMAALTRAYETRGVNIVTVGGGWQFRTAPDLAPALRKVVELPRRLPRVAMESLAIIAYHQPVTRTEIEEIRGAALSQNTLDLLLENGLVTPKGRKETPGRPTLWGTTPAFLAQFGLNDLRELPKREELLIDPTGPALSAPRPEAGPPAEPDSEAPAPPAVAEGEPE